MDKYSVIKHFCGVLGDSAHATILLLCGIATCHAQPSELEAKFNKAERLFKLDNWVQARDLYAECEAAYAQDDPAKAMISKFSRLRADAETRLSYETVSQTIAADLTSTVAMKDPDVKLRGLIVKATADLSVHDPTLSGEEWQQVIDLARQMKDPFWEERAEGELGIVAYLQGDTEKAVMLNTAAFQKARQLKDVAGMIRAISLKGVGLLERDGADDALPLFNQALSLAKSNPDVRFPLMAYMGKSEALEKKGDEAGSGALLEEAKRFVDQVGMTVYRADLLSDLGNRAEKLNRIEEAKRDYEEAATAAKNSQMPRPFAAATFQLAELHAKQNDWLAAEQLIPRGLAADRELIDIQFYPQHLAAAAKIEAHLGHIQTAEEYLSQAGDVIEAAMANVPSANIKASLISTMSSVYSAHFQLALEAEHNLPKAMSVLEDARGRVIADHLRTRPEKPTNHDPKIAALDRKIADIQLALMSPNNSRPAREKLLQQLHETEFQLEPLVYAHDSGKRMPRLSPMPLAEVQRGLATDEVVLEYVLGEEKSFVIAITKSNAHAYVLPSEPTVRKFVEGYAGEVKADADLLPNERVKAAALYRMIVAPVKETHGHSKIIVIPDGVLNLVGFDSLVDETGDYLVKKSTISYAASATVLMALDRRPLNSGASKMLLAFGGPRLPNQTASKTGDGKRGLLDLDGGKITVLRAAAGEAREVATDIGGDPKEVFVNDDATESELKRQAISRFKVIHFAAHAFADLNNPDRSAVVLAPDAKTGDDGLLQIREIRELSLPSDLVTLSACDAGLGRVEGIEGMESLVNAFIFAGARTVLASRWEIDDTFSATLMDDVYKQLAKGATVPDALRSAQLKFLNIYGRAARPIYWSAFFVSGAADTRINVQLSKSDTR
jgi:CHAT domain-containing protein